MQRLLYQPSLFGEIFFLSFSLSFSRDFVFRTMNILIVKIILQPQYQWMGVYDKPWLPWSCLVRDFFPMNHRYLVPSSVVAISHLTLFSFVVCSYSVRIANELGKGDAKAAKFSIKVLVSTSVIIGLFFWVLCLIFGRNLGYLFSDEKAVADTVADLSTLLAFSILLNSIYPVLSGKSRQSCEV